MDELIAAINALGESSVVDYVINYASLFFALLAIVVSVYVANVQNKVSLFNMCYDAYVEIGRVIEYAVRLRPEGDRQNIDDPVLALNVFEAVFGVDTVLSTSDGDTGKDIIRTNAAVNAIKKTVLTSRFVFKELEASALEAIFEDLRRYLVQAIALAHGSRLSPQDMEDLQVKRDAFCTKCQAFKAEQLDLLTEQLRLNRSFCGWIVYKWHCGCRWCKKHFGKANR